MIAGAVAVKEADLGRYDGGGKGRGTSAKLDITIRPSMLAAGRSPLSRSSYGEHLFVFKPLPLAVAMET